MGRCVILLALAAFCMPALAAERGEEPYLIVPKDYTPQKAWPITLVGQNQTSAAQMADKPYFAMYCGPGPDCKAALAAVARKYCIDPFRVYATAFSRTGHATLEMAYTYPGGFAAIAPVDEDMRFKADRPVQKIDFLKYIRTPTLMCHGNHDSFRTSGRKNFDAMTAAGCPVWWHTFTGGHNPDPIFFNDMKLLTDFFDKHTLDPFPKDVLHVVVSTGATRAWWVDADVRGEAVDTPNPPVFRVQVKDANRIEVEGDANILGLRLMLNDKLVDMAKPVTVVRGEKVLYTGPASGDLYVKLAEGKPASHPANRADGPLWELLEAIRSQPNETGACDWVYLEMDTKLADPRLERDVARHVSLDIGLRAADGPATAKIAPESKCFLPLDLTAARPAAKADMATLARKLPVEVDATAQTFGLAGDPAAPSGSDPVRLVPEGEGANGQVLLVKVRLTNRGDKAAVGKMMLYRAPSFGMPRPVWTAGDFAAGLHEVASTGKISNQWSPRMGQFPYQSILWLSLNPTGKLAAAEGRNEGAFHATWAVQRELTVAPGATLNVPLLVVAVPAADPKAAAPKTPDLSPIVERIKPAVLEAMGT